MQPSIEIISEKRLIGKRLGMILADNQTPALWRSFMPRRKEIMNNLNTELISMQVYDTAFDFINFDLHRPFEKWAAVEVSDFEAIPKEMEAFVLPAGMYAVFLYKGAASAAAPFFQSIFGTWLPNSAYLLDDRPHFEILGEKYKNEDPDSEESIWVPIKLKI